jgi:hypothetical protein
MGLLPSPGDEDSGVAFIPEFSRGFVATAPGETVVTRTVVPIISDARLSEKSFTPALAAQYIVCPGTGTKPPMLERFTMCAWAFQLGEAGIEGASQ